MAPGPVDRWSLRVVDDDRSRSLGRPFPCLDQAAGAAASTSGPVDVVVLHALAVLRVFDPDWVFPGADCELVPLVELVVVGKFAVPRVPRTDWLSPGGDRGVAGGSSPHDDAEEARLLAAPRASPGLTNWGRSDAAAERSAQVGCCVAGLLLPLLGLVVLLAVLGPPTLRASSSPSTLFELVTDLLPRLTVGCAFSSSSNRDPFLAQSSAPAGPSCGGKGGDSEPAGESVRESSQVGCWLVLSIPINAPDSRELLSSLSLPLPPAPLYRWLAK